MEGNIQSGNPPCRNAISGMPRRQPAATFFPTCSTEETLSGRYLVGCPAPIPERGAAAFPLSFELVRESGEHSEAMWSRSC